MLKMLQANYNNNTLKPQVDMVERLDNLNKWQKEQKRLLDERQNMQRQMLGLEHQNMYEEMGLVIDRDLNLNKSDGGGDTSLDLPKEFGRKENMGVDREIAEMENRLFEGSSNALVKISNLLSYNSSYCDDGDLDRQDIKPKRPYLKRGEGIKQRYKISPESLRLNNLPRYKFATRHPKIKNLQRRKLAPKLEVVDLDKQEVNEMQFERMLTKSKPGYSSTPDAKLTGATLSSISITLPKVRLAPGETKENNDNEEEHQVKPYAAITWSKVLDSQQVKPIPIQKMRAPSSKSEKVNYNKNIGIEDDENLNIFELLERQASLGNIDINSTCVKEFLNHKNSSLESLENEAGIPIDKRCALGSLRPKVDEVLGYDSDDIHSSEEFEDKSVRSRTPRISTYLTDDSNNNSALNVDKVDLHVRFSEENTTCEYENPDDIISDSSAILNEETTCNKSLHLFHQLKDALLTALLSKTDGECNSTEHNLVMQSPPSALTQELQEKSNIIKFRLEELEKEISDFKSNNMELMRAKQEYETERAHFNQERNEALDRLKDDKIQMEMYLHDERIKIEEDKRKFEHQIRVQKQTFVNKERKEISRLKAEVEALQIQLKQKDQLHASAQARLRVQIRNLERDQKQLYEDIERLTKENKRLQNEKQNLEREGNNKMLMEINKNIAKLAPKLAAASSSNSSPEYPDLNNRSYNKNLKLTHSPQLIQKPNSKNQRIMKAPPNTRNTSKTDVSNDTENAYSHKTEMPLRCNESDGDLVDDDEEDIISELQVGQNSKSVKSFQYSTGSNTSKETIVIKCDRDKHEEEKQKRLESVTGIVGSSGNGISKSNNETVEHFRREIINPDGSRDIWYPNGNLKKISSDGMNIRILYFNKDIKETNVNEGTVKYYFAETNTWHTTYLDGLEITEFPNGQTEHRYKNGVVEIHLPDNSVKIINPAEKDKLEEWRFADGTNLIQMRNGDRVLMLPNGQKEIHTKLNKRREYPDGTVKLVYPDGSQETRYCNGRIRLKDKEGNLVMDTERT